MSVRDLLGLSPSPSSPRPRVMRFPRGRQKGWDPADTGHLFSKWGISHGSPDDEYRRRAAEEVGRSRELERSNPWVVHFFLLYLANVFGESGIRLVPRITDEITGSDGKTKTIPDEEANRKIRDGWDRWGRHGEPTVDGLSSWVAAQKLMGVSLKRDGEVFVRLYRGGRFGIHGFRIGLFEADHVSRSLSRGAGSGTGNLIHMGIERDEFNRPVAYWMQRRHPGSTRITTSMRFEEHERIPAEEVIHLYDATRIAQSRGLPALESGIASLNMLQGYEEAELVAARVAASKMGFITTETGEEYVGDADSTITEGEILETLEPGMIHQLSRDQSFEGFDPTHPTTAFGPFVKQMLRRFAATAGASYNSISQDLEGVNFSSLRSGKLEERDIWRLAQGHFVEVVSERVFESWLPQALLSGDLELPPTPDKFSAHGWQGRRWAWIDPLKEAQANETELDSLTTSLTEIANAKGRTLRELFEEIRSEMELAEEMDIPPELLPYFKPKRNSTPEAPEEPPAPPPAAEE